MQIKRNGYGKYDQANPTVNIPQSLVAQAKMTVNSGMAT